MVPNINYYLVLSINFLLSNHVKSIFAQDFATQIHRNTSMYLHNIFIIKVTYMFFRGRL